jgi:hypothetical protein
MMVARHIHRIALAAALVAVGFPPGRASAQPAQAAPVAAAPGVITVRYFYEAPTTIDPTYHTAIWLEDANGTLVKTLYVSQELSDKEYKMGNVCPDWVKQAKWEAAPKNEVAAVTAPTPTVGTGEMSFDLATLGVAPGTYGFRFQMHVEDDHNVLYRGVITVGGPAVGVALETVTGPGKPSTTDQFVKDVEVRYLAAK